MRIPIQEMSVGHYVVFDSVTHTEFFWHIGGTILKVGPTYIEVGLWRTQYVPAERKVVVDFSGGEPVFYKGQHRKWKASVRHVFDDPADAIYLINESMKITLQRRDAIEKIKQESELQLSKLVRTIKINKGGLNHGYDL